MERFANRLLPIPTFTSPKNIHIVIDVDSFESQVWIQENPHLQGKPLLFVNNSNVTLAVSYEAKAFGVNRKDSLFTGKQKCRDLDIFTIPNEHGKPNQSKARDASYRIQKTVRDAVRKFVPGSVVSMQSKDEVYINVTKHIDHMMEQPHQSQLNVRPHKKTIWIPNVEEDENSHIRLAMAGMYAEQILMTIRNETGYVASAGVAGPLVVAKIACGNDKPDALTIVQAIGHDELYEMTKLRDTPGLKGKHGEQIVQNFKKPDGKELISLLDFKLHVPVDETLCQLLNLNKGDVKKLQQLVAARDFEELVDKRKQELMSSRRVPYGEIFSTREGKHRLKEYIGELCLDMQDKVLKEQELFGRVPKKLQIKFKRDQSSSQRKFLGGSGDTTLVDFPRRFSPEKMKQCVWDGLQQIWNELTGMEKPAGLNNIIAIILTARFEKNE